MNGERRPTPARGQVLAGRYVVGERIGKGAASVVYRAFDQGLQTWIAIKVLDWQRWADMPEPLFRELRHAREIQHPHVCRLYDVVGAEPGTPPFLTMAQAEGGTLRDTLTTAPDRP
jgi:serine/threonine protein kinase